jgi:hypothetical protein
MWVSVLLQAFAAADIEDGDGKEKNRRRNENYVLQRKLLDCPSSDRGCPR